MFCKVALIKLAFTVCNHLTQDQDSLLMKRQNCQSSTRPVILGNALARKVNLAKQSSTISAEQDTNSGSVY